MDHWPSTIRRPFSVVWGVYGSDVADDIHPFSDARFLRPETFENKIHVDQGANGGTVLWILVLKPQSS